MSKFFQNGKSLAVILRPQSAQQATEVARLRRELEHIALLTTSGGISDLTKLLWNNLIAQCKERQNPFTAMEDATRPLAEAYEQEMERRFRRLRK